MTPEQRANLANQQREAIRIASTPDPNESVLSRYGVIGFWIVLALFGVWLIASNNDSSSDVDRGYPGQPQFGERWDNPRGY